MAGLGLETKVVDELTRSRARAHLQEAGVVLPTLTQLSDPTQIPIRIRRELEAISPDDPHPLNLFRVHWYNDPDRRGFIEVPGHVDLPEALTGVSARILVAYGDRFPMIGAHKVMAAYGCLVPRVVTGQFDPARQRAIWPSTGNYCRGGVAISRILGCRGAAVLPEGMSEERFRWLESWVGDPSDIVRTPGSESNVKEIYDACNELAVNEKNVVFNQFSEFGNHLMHLTSTGPAMERVFLAARTSSPGLELAAFVSATGSAGTLAAGDYLKKRYRSRNVAVEALECPTMLSNGFGDHNIQGIGDKHIPLIHNVTNTDVVTAVSDRSTDLLNLLFNLEEGRKFLVEERGLSPAQVEAFSHFGLSSLCNVVAAIKLARYLRLGSSSALVTVATDGASLYRSELDKAVEKYYPGGFDRDAAASVFEQHLAGIDTNHVRELDRPERDRIFNLGYFTWVEQQGISEEDFEARRSQEFWQGLHECVPAWDQLIEEFQEDDAQRSSE